MENTAVLDCAPCGFHGNCGGDVAVGTEAEREQRQRLVSLVFRPPGTTRYLQPHLQHYIFMRQTTTLTTCCHFIGAVLISNVLQNRVAKKKKIKEEHKRRQANPFTGEGGPQKKWAWADEVKPGEIVTQALMPTF